MQNTTKLLHLLNVNTNNQKDVIIAINRLGLSNMEKALAAINYMEDTEQKPSIETKNKIKEWVPLTTQISIDST